jgi:hypothetical protein
MNSREFPPQQSTPESIAQLYSKLCADIETLKEKVNLPYLAIEIPEEAHTSGDARSSAEDMRDRLLNLDDKTIGPMATMLAAIEAQWQRLHANANFSVLDNDVQLFPSLNATDKKIKELRRELEIVAAHTNTAKAA